MNLADEFHPVPKSAQLHNNRQKPTRNQKSNLSAKETKRLYERSGGVCERCDRARGTGRAHIMRRWKHEEKPTAEDFIHLCSACHTWADNTREGRKWLREFGEKLRRTNP